MTPLRWILGTTVLAAVAGTLVWLIVRSILRSTDPGSLAIKWTVTLVILGLVIAGIATETGNSKGGAFVVPFVCVILGIVMSVMWAPAIGSLLARPLTSMIDGGDTDEPKQPFYSIAIGKRKRGLYPEAIIAVRNQLAQFPTDFSGQLLLAEIQAENLNDLDAAQLTVDRFINQPGHSPNHIAYALNSMADWRLKYHRDAEAARQSLERIIELFPDTEFSHNADQRIAHLGNHATRSAEQDSTPIKLKPGAERIGLMQSSSFLRPAEESKEITAERYVAHLEEHPSDDEAREKLALLYAEQFGRIDLAIAQFEELIAQPNARQTDVVRWLHSLAELHIKQAGDYDSAREALERIIVLYPDRACSQLARNRLNLLGLELKATKTSQAVKLGSYEQNIGLKSPTRPTGPARKRSRPE